MGAPLLLGLDGGGTKTASVILDPALRELGRGQGGPCNIATCDNDTLRESVTSAARTALESAGLPPDTRFASVCAGAAGFVVKSRRAEFARYLAEWIPADRHRVEPDYVAAYWGATEGEPGVVVIAGTGAVAYGRNAEGQEARADGRGFLLGDRGSGFDIGRTALRRLLRRLDMGWELKPLDRRIMAALGAKDPSDVMERVYIDFEPARIAELATTVGALAAEGDDLARSLVNVAAAALRGSANAVLKLLSLPTDSPVYLLGGLWHIGGPLLSTFTGPNERLGMHVPLTVREPRHDAAYGAALLASRPAAGFRTCSAKSES